MTTQGRDVIYWFNSVNWWNFYREDRGNCYQILNFLPMQWYINIFLMLVDGITDKKTITIVVSSFISLTKDNQKNTACCL